MEERNETCRPERFPGEVVETYRQPDPREVVETYARPLPGARPAGTLLKTAARKKRRKGLWIFLAVFAAAALLAAGARLLAQRYDRAHRDPCEKF